MSHKVLILISLHNMTKIAVCKKSQNIEEILQINIFPTPLASPHFPPYPIFSDLLEQPSSESRLNK